MRRTLVLIALFFVAITSFAILGFAGENMAKWIVTLILSIAFVVLGIIGIIDYKTNK